jgi:2-aminoethylphosphonate transport system substrate-binding protein
MQFTVTQAYKGIEMKSRIRMLAALIFAAFAATAYAQGVVTIYAADGLHDGNPSWFGDQFAAFTAATGIKVQYVEAGSSGVVDRIAKERSNPQADVLVTLPPFMQKGAADGLLQPFAPSANNVIAAADRDPAGLYVVLMNNFPNFIYNAGVLKEAPKSYTDLLDPRFKKKVQYSTPGQAGDGTALMLQAFHAFGSKEAGLAYLGKLQANNLGPSASTGKLTALVNKGEIYVANGDMQMNLAQMRDNPNVQVFFPAGPDGRRTAFPLPYYIGLVANAPNADNGRKLIEFLLSQAAQKEISSVAQGFPVRSDVHPTDANFLKLNAMLQGVEVWHPDWAQVLKDLPADVAAYNKAIAGN